MAKFRDELGNVFEIGSPELNPQLVEGKTRVSDDTPLSANILTTAPITSADLKGEAPIIPTRPAETAIFDINKFIEAQLKTTEPSALEKQETGIIGEAQRALRDLERESTFRTETERVQDISGQRKLVQDLTGQLRTLQSELGTLQVESAAIPLRVQEESVGRGRTAAGVAPLQAGELRKNAIQKLATSAKAFTISAQLQAAQGNLALALDLVDRAVEQEFAPQRARLDAALKDLKLIEPQLTREEKRRAELRTAFLSAQREQVEIERKEREAVLRLATDVASTGRANAEQLRAIVNAPTRESALQLAAPFLEKEDKILSVTEAKALGVPFGTTEKEAFGRVPVDGVDTEEVEAFAQDFAAGRIVAGNIPQSIRGDVLIRSREITKENLIAEVASYKNKEEATRDLERNRDVIINQIGLGGFEELNKEVEKRFPETKGEETGGIFGVAKSFFKRLFGDQ